MLWLLAALALLPAPAPAAGTITFTAGKAGTPCWFASDSLRTALGSTECATVTLPRTYDGSAPGETVDFFVRRFPASARNHPVSRGQLWLLSGGPGEAGDSMEPAAAALRAAPFDILVPDHRGTGLSSRLACPAAFQASPGTAATDEQVLGCASHLASTLGIGLRAFSCSNAARDVLAVAIQLQRQSGGDVALYGASYGTLWAQRILYLDTATLSPPTTPWPATLSQLSNADLSGRGVVAQTILDGVVAPNLYSLHTQQTSFTASMRLVCEQCRQHAGCRSLMGPDPCRQVELAVARLQDGSCPAAAAAALGVDEYLAGNGLMVSLLDTFVAPLAFARRLARCNDADQAIIAGIIAELRKLAPVVVGALFAAPNSFPLLMTVALQEVVDRSENTPPAYALNAGAQISPNYAQFFAPAAVNYWTSAWPAKYEDPLRGLYPARLRARMLLLNGGADANTPVGYATEAMTQYTQLARAGPSGNGSDPLPPPVLLTLFAAGHVILSRDPAVPGCVVQFLNITARGSSSPSTASLADCLPPKPMNLDSVGKDAAIFFAGTLSGPTSLTSLLGAGPPTTTVAASSAATTSCDCSDSASCLHVAGATLAFVLITLVVLVAQLVLGSQRRGRSILGSKGAVVEDAADAYAGYARSSHPSSRDDELGRTLLRNE